VCVELVVAPVVALVVAPVVALVVCPGELVVASANGSKRRACNGCGLPTTPNELPVLGREIVMDRVAGFTGGFGCDFACGLCGGTGFLVAIDIISL